MRKGSVEEREEEEERRGEVEVEVVEGTADGVDASDRGWEVVVVRCMAGLV